MEAVLSSEISVNLKQIVLAGLRCVFLLYSERPQFISIQYNTQNYKLG
jgi:hypothetical protein